MKRAASLLIGALLGAGSATAADMPIKAPVAPLAAYDWTGFYLGFNVGYGVGRNGFTDTTTSFDRQESLTSQTTERFRLGPGGWLAGGQAGYNWQFSPTWVAGVEADWAWTGQEDSVCVRGCDSGAAHFSQKLNWLATVRGRLGYTRGGWLGYITAGGAWGRVNEANQVSLIETASRTINQTLGGWTVGAGIEVAIAANWTAKLEYLYVDLGSTGAVSVTQSDDRFTYYYNSAGQFRDHIFRFGLNYGLGGTSNTAASQALTSASHNWNGFYAGGNVGYGVARNHAFNVISHTWSEQLTLSPAGVIGGGQIGYNWQIARNWVAGVELDGQWSGQQDSICTNGCNFVPQPHAAAGGINVEQQLRWLATARGRAGYNVGGWLGYVTGGAAWGEIANRERAAINNNVTKTQFSHTNAGWTIGTGIETALNGRWTAKFEYLYVDLGTGRDVYLLTPPQFGNQTFQSQVRDHIVRFGLNYNFSQASRIGDQ